MDSSSNQPPKATILVVDDTLSLQSAVSMALKMAGYEVLEASTGAGALRLATQKQPAAILLDVRLPDMDGFEVCRALKDHHRTCEIPVLFMTALNTTAHKIKGLQVGAVDYLTKPVQHDEMLARLATHLRLRNLTTSIQEQNNRLALSNEVAQVISRAVELQQASLPEMLQKIVDLIQTRLKYYFVGVWLFADQQNGLVLEANQSRDGIRPFDTGYVLGMEQAQSIVMTCFQSRQPYRCPDVNVDPNYLVVEELPETRSELALPLCLGPLVLGVMDFHSDTFDAFNADDQALLDSLTSQIAVAVQNAQLFSSIRRFSEHLEELVEQRTEELQNAYNKLEQIDQSKSAFIDVAAHELRTPLTVIRGYTQLLETLVSEQEPALNVVQSIVKGVDRLNVVVNSMLDIAKINVDAVEISPTLTSLALILASVQREMGRIAADRKVELRMVDLDQLPSITADFGLLQKVFYHLIINAIKYTPDGGTVTISGITHPDGVEILVQDTGIGIDPAHQSLIFEQFFQTGNIALHSSGVAKFKGGGPGLGLPIARGIVLAHGGRIWVESPGCDERTLPGSTFHVWLPL